MEMEVWEKPVKKAIVLAKLNRAIAARGHLGGSGTNALWLVDRR
jgi:hypothetical protein